jgi:hypothetical protein
LDPATKNKIPIYSPNGKPFEHGGEGSKRLIHAARYDKSNGWNTVEIIVKGDKATYIVNGKINNSIKQ